MHVFTDFFTDGKFVFMGYGIQMLKWTTFGPTWCRSKQSRMFNLCVTICTFILVLSI